MYSRTAWGYCKEHFESHRILPIPTAGRNHTPGLEPIDVLHIHLLLGNASGRFCYRQELSKPDSRFWFSGGTDRARRLPRTRIGRLWSRGRKISLILCGRTYRSFLKSSEKAQTNITILVAAQPSPWQAPSSSAVEGRVNGANSNLV